MQAGEIFAYCSSGDAPLKVGMKLNMSPCEEHADCYEFYCDACVEAAVAHLEGHGLMPEAQI
jgi:hypothetical protein